jgi:diguanylate cyclase (GGDEF)-like protein/PAS domain S-box-containing protein
MNNDSSDYPETDSFELTLRERAEALLAQSCEEQIDLSPDEIARLIHDLSVHQIELELQNEELRSAQNQLQDTRDRYAQLYHQAPVGYLTLDANGMIQQANQTFSEMLGCELSELKERALVDFMAGADRSQFLGRFKAFFNNPEGKSIDARLQGKARSGFFARLTGRSETAALSAAKPSPPVLLMIVNDISAQKAMEDVLRKSEAQYRAVIETSLDGFWMVDTQGRLLEVNEAYARQSGYSQQELLSMHITDLDAQESPEQTAVHLDAVLRKGGDLFETVHRTRDGTLWPAEINTAYWPTAGGRLFCFIRNIHQRQRTQALLKARLHLSELALHSSLDELLQAALDTAEKLTQSQIGFFHFVDPDQEHLTLQAWSTRTLRETCAVKNLGGLHYPVSQAGVWVDCVRQRQPVIHNDYLQLPHRHGLPEGHAPVIRELTVPVLRNRLIVAVMGVGNKPTNYTDEDVEAVDQIASMIMDIVERKRAEEALRITQERLELALDGADVGLYNADLRTGEVVVDERYLKMLGYASGESTLTVENWLRRIHPEDRPRVVSRLEGDWRRHGQRFEMEYRLQCQSGAWIWILDRGQGFDLDHQGKPTRAAGTLLDITARREAETRLRLAAVAFDTSEAMFITDQEGVIQQVNRAFCRLTGYTAEEVVGQNPRLLQSGRHNEEFYATLWHHLLTNGHWSGEIWNRHRDGKVYPQWQSISTVYDEQGNITNFVATFLDLTQQKAAEEAIRRLAYYDSLTGLPNRRLFLDRLASAQAVARREGNCGALLFIDLDAFKRLNEARGHETGDRVLKEVAERLLRSLREDDIVARLSSDEFAVLLTQLPAPTGNAARLALGIAEKLRSVLAAPFLSPEGGHSLSASIGIALFPASGTTASELLKQADTAMYQAKAAGRNAIRFFESAMQIQVETRFTLESELRRTLIRDELRLYFQPQVDNQGRIVGAEALLRWQHPEKGLVSPAAFIPLAEETGVIVPMGEWVLAETCRMLVRLAAAECRLRLAINVSPRQFRQSGFLARLKAILAATGADPSRLTLEITEGVAIDDLPGTIAKMAELKTLGLHFSIDDFGTGYSSLAYLKRLPVDELKIDRSFIQDAPTDANDGALVETILAVAQHLKLHVVAEGVETVEQATFLKARGCTFYQGYLYGRPAPIETFLESILSKSQT